MIFYQVQVTSTREEDFALDLAPEEVECRFFCERAKVLKSSSGARAFIEGICASTKDDFEVSGVR